MVGRFHTSKNIHFESMRQMLASLWRPVKGVDIQEGPRGTEYQLYIFQFFHELDMSRVLASGSWTFDSHLLLCRRMVTGEQLTQAELYETSIWVQLHDIPIGFMSQRVCTDIGNFIGSYIEADPANFSGEWRNFLRVRVSMDVRKPLKRRMKLKRSGGEWNWVTFRYERLPTFCFFCGVIGHSDKFCGKLYDAPSGHGEYLYGPSLRAMGRRPLNRPGDRWLRIKNQGGSGSAELVMEDPGKIPPEENRRGPEHRDPGRAAWRTTAQYGRHDSDGTTRMVVQFGAHSRVISHGAESWDGVADGFQSESPNRNGWSCPTYYDIILYN